MKKLFTHTGVVFCDKRGKVHFEMEEAGQVKDPEANLCRCRVVLRETKRYWTTTTGIQYFKDDGSASPRRKNPDMHLDLSSIKPMAEPQKFEVG